MINEHIKLSNSAKIVQDVLLNKGLAFEVVELSSRTRTAKDAATTIGCEIAQIIKSLLFRTEKTNRPILILASGINRVNEETIERLISEKIIKADANFTREITGFAIGGVPPVGQNKQ
jgi:prolyl-tRNA editing enzyme YbaK/EbsC (Cys-tRNA(Pro) deacylase)